MEEEIRVYDNPKECPVGGYTHLRAFPYEDHYILESYTIKLVVEYYRWGTKELPYTEYETRYFQKTNVISSRKFRSTLWKRVK